MNKFRISDKPLMWFMALLLAAFVSGCGGGGGGGSGGVAAVTTGTTAVIPGTAGSPGAAATDPAVGSSNPGNNATNVPTSTNSWNGVANVVTGTQLTATFTQPMNPTTVTPVGVFTLKVTTGADVPGTVAMNTANTVATFTPTAAALLANTNYTATITTAAKNAGGTAMPSPVSWSFMTAAALTTGQAPVNLGTAGDYAIFANILIANATACITPCITGDMGIGPARTSSAITGWSLTVDGTNTFSTSAQVSGQIYAADYIGPPASTPTRVNTASLDMGLAYNDAAGRTAAVGPPFLNLGGGTLTTQTLAPGVYTWGGNVTLGAAQILTLSGSPTDVWIFQVGGFITTDATSRVNLAGGALAKNVFWQVAGSSVTIGAAPAHFEGVVLCGPICAINFGNSATVNGRLLSQTAVNLDQTAVTQPAP